MTTISRRRMLQGITAGGLLALPFLRSLPSAEAQTFPARFIAFFSPNESIDPAHWVPGSGFSLQPVMSPLLPFKDQLLVIGPMKNQVRDLDAADPGGHDSVPHILTGVPLSIYGDYSKNEYWPGGPSIDHAIASHLGMSSLVVSAGPIGKTGQGRITASGAGQVVHPIVDPLVAFDSVLGNYTVPPDVLAEQREQSRRVLDAVGVQSLALRDKLPGADRLKLEWHIEHLMALRDKLDDPLSASCTDPAAPGSVSNPTDNANVPTVLQSHMEVLVEAFKCDVTRAGVVQLGSGGAGQLTPVWPGHGIDLDDDFHKIAHDYNDSPTNSTIKARREQLESWIYAQIAYLLQLLDAVPEGDGTMLDNTVVLCTKPMGTGHSSSDHLFLLCGGKNLGINTGRYLNTNQMPHNRLLAACANLFGMNLSGFGHPQLSGVLDLS